MKALAYSDVCLIPNYGILKSRLDADATIQFNNNTYRLPLILSNMPSVINWKIAEQLSSYNYFYIFHRFGHENQKDLYWFIDNANKNDWKNISISIGTKKDDRDLIEYINHKHKRVDYITLDIAHADSVLAQEMLTYLKYEFSPEDKPYIIAGNVGTKDGVNRLFEWGADCVKIFIGPGLSCQTYNVTGFGTLGTFSTALECCKDTPGPIILDGGVREIGDFSKALVAGMSVSKQPIFVMSGSIFSSCIDSPTKGTLYYGNASRQNGHLRHIEGKTIKTTNNGMTILGKLDEIRQALSSAISYAGGKDLSAFRKVKWVQI